ncbi:hypothetical protein MAR_007505 [Mya arenaria]|uniref:Uncharacterized protein n=1 Tax=Mya arenaria TaxID=6604 RepID=A0ABY7DCK5_MYAAR|nr:hypothetical protein MAR_007505 [Mya arenaria]
MEIFKLVIRSLEHGYAYKKWRKGKHKSYEDHSFRNQDLLLDVESTEDFQVMPVYCFQCFDRIACRNEKIANGKRPSCNKMSDIEQHYGSAMVILKKKKRFSQVRFFMDNLKKLFKVDDITDSNKLLQQLKTQVPVTYGGRCTNTDYSAHICYFK